MNSLLPFQGFGGFKGAPIRDVYGELFWLFSRYNVTVGELGPELPNRGYILAPKQYSSFIENLLIGNLKGLLGVEHHPDRRDSLPSEQPSNVSDIYTLLHSEVNYKEWASIEEVVLNVAKKNPTQYSFATLNFGPSDTVKVQGVPNPVLRDRRGPLSNLIRSNFRALGALMWSLITGGLIAAGIVAFESSIYLSQVPVMAASAMFVWRVNQRDYQVLFENMRRLSFRRPASLFRYSYHYVQMPTSNSRLKPENVFSKPIEEFAKDFLSLNFSPPEGYNQVEAEFNELEGLLSKTRDGQDELSRDEKKEISAILDSLGSWMDLPSGERDRKSFRALLSKYSEVTLAGSGSFANVYHATRMDGTNVALKVPRTDTKFADEAFLSELTALSELGQTEGNEGLLRIYDRFVMPYPGIELEWLDGGTLADWTKPCSVDEIAKITLEISKVIVAAHSKSIVHHNIRPHNIAAPEQLFTSDNRPKLADWSLSSALTPIGLSSTSLEASMRGLLSPTYAAPEQLDRKFGDPGKKTDVFQLALIMYEFISGEDIAIRRRTIRSALDFEAVPLSNYFLNAKSLDRLLLNALNHHIDGRISIDEFGRGLADFLRVEWPKLDHTANS